MNSSSSYINRVILKNFYICFEWSYSEQVGFIRGIKDYNFIGAESNIKARMVERRLLKGFKKNKDIMPWNVKSFKYHLAHLASYESLWTW